MLVLCMQHAYFEGKKRGDFVICYIFFRASKGMDLWDPHQWDQRLLHLRVHHKACSHLISHGCHLGHKGSLLCHPQLIGSNWTHNPCSKGHIFLRCSNPHQHPRSSSNNNLCCLINHRSISGNKFRHPGLLYTCLISHRLRGYRGQEIRNLHLLWRHNLVQHSQGLKVD